MDYSLSPRKRIIAQNFSNAQHYNKHANVQAQVCNLLLKQLEYQNYTNVLEIGAGQGQLTKKLAKHITTDNWHINELCHQHLKQLQTIIPDATFQIGDAESLTFDTFYDLIISANAVQWFDNPLAFIKMSHQNLQSGGQLLFSTFTPKNFYQIKELTGQGLEYPSTQQWLLELEKYEFSKINTSVHTFQLIFNNPRDVLKHISHTGVSANTDQNFKWTKSSLQYFVQNYQEKFSIDTKNQTKGTNKVALTYEALIINAIKT